jgi:hypothetical protein
MIEVSGLPAAPGRELAIAVLGCVQTLGGQVVFLDEAEDFAPVVVKVACLGRGPYLVLVERPGDPAKGRTRRFTGYWTDKIGQPDVLKLDPDQALFVLSEKAFYRPADWRLDPIVDPRLWFNEVLTVLHAALAPSVLAMDH